MLTPSFNDLPHYNLSSFMLSGLRFNPEAKERLLTQTIEKELKRITVTYPAAGERLVVLNFWSPSNSWFTRIGLLYKHAVVSQIYSYPHDKCLITSILLADTWRKGGNILNQLDGVPITRAYDLSNFIRNVFGGGDIIYPGKFYFKHKSLASTFRRYVDLRKKVIAEIVDYRSPYSGNISELKGLLKGYYPLNRLVLDLNKKDIDLQNLDIEFPVKPYLHYGLNNKPLPYIRYRDLIKFLHENLNNLKDDHIALKFNINRKEGDRDRSSFGEIKFRTDSMHTLSTRESELMFNDSYYIKEFPDLKLGKDLSVAKGILREVQKEYLTGPRLTLGEPKSAPLKTYSL